jgi:DNA-binding winged helix-turn-helix (wHTH) protein
MRMHNNARIGSDRMDLALRDPRSKAPEPKPVHPRYAPTSLADKRNSVRSGWKDEVTEILADVDGVPVLVRILFQEMPAEIGRDLRSLLSNTFQGSEDQSVRPRNLPNETVLRVGSLQLDLIDRSAARGDRPIDLRPREYRLLKYMMQRHDEVLTREVLLKEVWHYKVVPETNLVDVHMGRLRRKVDSANDWSMIRNVRGVGFVLNATPFAQDSPPTRAGRSTAQPAAEHLRSDEKGGCHDGR